MNYSYQNSLSGIISQLRLIFIIMLSMMIVFTAVVCFIRFSDKTPVEENELTPVFLAVSFVFLVITVFAGRMVIKQKLRSLDPTIPLERKLSFYRGFLVVRLALSEAPILLCLVFFLLSGNVILLGIASTGLLNFLLSFPSMEKCVKELNLSYSEEQELRGNTFASSRF